MQIQFLMKTTLFGTFNFIYEHHNGGPHFNYEFEGGKTTAAPRGLT